jgi:hypothetical protein
MRLKISKLDPDSLKPGGVYLLQGRRSTGKSTLLKQVLYWMKDKHDLVIAMTPTESTKEMFCSILPAQFVYDGFNVNILEAVMETQKELIAKGKVRRVCIVLDDLSFDAKAFREKAVGAAFRNSRHYNCSLCITAQAVYDLLPSLRQQVDVVFALRDPIAQSRKKLWLAYFGMMRYDDFVACFEACTSNFGAICLDQSVPTSDVTECVFYTKADVTLPPFRVCRDIYFRIALNPPREKKSQPSVEVVIPPIADRKRTIAVVS